MRRLLLLLMITSPAAIAAVHPTADIERAAAAAVRAQYSADADVELAPVRLDPRLRLAACPAELSAEPQRAAGGVVSVRLRCPHGNGWSIYVQVRVREFRKVLVLSRSVASGAAITAADVRSERRNVAKLAAGYLESADEAAGLVAARPLTAQTVLAPAMLKPPLLVERNQQVRLVAIVAGARIVGSGIALEPGAAGELVRARNRASGRVVQGRVTADGEIRIGG